MSLSVQPSDCSDLIGRPYRLGGGEGTIDCIQLVYEVLERMSIPTPAFQPCWYDAGQMEIGRALLGWGKRIDNPSYDGDVIVLRQERPAFAVIWLNGVLHINQMTERVAWCPTDRLDSRWAVRYCPMRKS